MNPDGLRRLDELESRHQITQLAADYCVGLMGPEHRDVFTSLWHEDASYFIPGRDEYHGIDRIRASYDVIFSLWDRTFHWTSNSVIGFENPDRATGRVDVFAFQEQQGGSGVCWVGSTYFDVYERRSNQWRFAERTTQRWFVSPALELPLPAPT
jgi:hypothetical protein